MGRQTNAFQEIVAYLYRLTESGAVVTESAFVAEPSGTRREIDILVEQEVQGSLRRIAVECRDRGRASTIEWIDGLIGKFAQLPIDHVVAIASKPFTESARLKAELNGIELVEAATALTLDWAARLITPWRVLEHRHELHVIALVDCASQVVVESRFDPELQRETYSTALSAVLVPTLVRMFDERLYRQLEIELNAKIREKWQSYMDDPKGRWCELKVSGLRIGTDPYFFGLGEVDAYFGVATVFEVTAVNPVGYVHDDRLLQQLKRSVAGTEIRIHWATATDGNHDPHSFEVSIR